MKYLTGFCLAVGIFGGALCAECPDGYTPTDTDTCEITCQPGYYVATAGAQCTEITDQYTYTDTPHTVTLGETSDAFLKTCPRTADGTKGVIPGAWKHNGIMVCTHSVSNLRMTEADRYGMVNCNASDIHSCVWPTHGVGGAWCYYTTGADGAAIYDNQRTDPVTGEGRKTCVGNSWLITCDAGYYAPYINTGEGLQHHPCNPVGAAYWSPAGDLNRYECPTGTATCGFGDCADSADDCMPYKKLKISGAGDVLLWPVKRSDKSLVVMYPDGTKYYAMTTPVAQPRGLHIKMPSGEIYTFLSPTDSFTTYDAGTTRTNVLMLE